MADAVEINAGSQGEITEQNIFVHRLMYAKCNFGSMPHPLNVAEVAGGHGVLFGPEEQPVLNANDWRPGVNVIHFGDCSPKTLDADGNVVEDTSTGIVKFFKDLWAFITTKKCTPLIEKVWYDTDTKYLIDGAPVMLTRSVLYCKRGGIITIDFTMQSSTPEGEVPPTPEDVQQTINDTNAAVDQALAEGKIDQATAEYMKEGFMAALEFSGGDIEEANKLFNDLVRYGNHPAFGMGPTVDYENSGPINEKFILYLKHTQSPLLSDCNSTMIMTSGSTGEQVNLRDAVQAVASNNQRIADTLSSEGETVNPSMTAYLNQLRQEEIDKYTYTYIDEFGQTQLQKMPLPDRLTTPTAPDDPFGFLPEKDVPHWYSDSKLTPTTIQMIDQTADNPKQPVVISLLNGLT